MLNFFLKAKHWHLFLLMFVLPLILHLIIMGITITTAISSNDPSKIFGVFQWFPLLIPLYLFGTYGWLGSVGLGLHKHLPEGVNMRIGRFKFFYFSMLVIMFIFLIFMSYMFSSVFSEIGKRTEPPMPPTGFFVAIPFIFLLQLFMVFCTIFVFYFNAKVYKSIELGYKAEFSDYIGQFFLIWFSFVGVWIMQPTINKIWEGSFERPEIDQVNNPDNDHDLLDN